MSEPLKLTPKLRELLERIEKHDGTVLLLSITGSGGGPSARALKKLLAADYVALQDHPTVTDRRSNEPATALAITDAGKAALQ